MGDGEPTALWIPETEIPSKLTTLKKYLKIPCRASEESNTVSQLWVSQPASNNLKSIITMAPTWEDFVPSYCVPSCSSHRQEKQEKEVEKEWKTTPGPPPTPRSPLQVPKSWGRLSKEKEKSMKLDEKLKFWFQDWTFISISESWLPKWDCLIAGRDWKVRWTWNVTENILRSCLGGGKKVFFLTELL